MVRISGGDILKSLRIVFLILISVLLIQSFPMTPVSAKADESRIEVTTTMQKTVTAEGVIQKQGMTTYQYGTHVLKDSNKKTLYALTSKSQKLDTYVGKQV